MAHAKATENEKEGDMTEQRAHMGINDMAAVWAVRYCLGRMTYAVDDCSRWLVSVWDRLDPEAQTCIRRDIDEQFARDDAARDNGNSRGLPLGMDIDRAAWQRVRNLWGAT